MEEKSSRLCSCSIWVAIISAMVVTSCAPLPQGVQGFNKGAEPADFYVPPSFDLVESRDWNRVPEFRHWSGRYRGRGLVDDVAPNFVREMPRLGWELSDIQPEGVADKVLIFYKGDEQARVHLAREFSSKAGGYVTAVIAQIGPRELESFDADEEIRRTLGERKTRPTSPTAPTGSDTRLVDPVSRPAEATVQPTSAVTTTPNSGSSSGPEVAR
ncbi:MAG: hypothetical protein AAF517_24840 [Planctomycetota bacterium]